MSSITPLTDGLPMGLLSSSAISGATPQEKLKSCCKALEGLFASEMLKEIGQSDTGLKDPASDQYGDFIQQALAQSVTVGHGLGLADMLEKALAPHPAVPATAASVAAGTPTAAFQSRTLPHARRTR
jgi:Rod binding domain-containing protein